MTPIELLKAAWQSGVTSVRVEGGQAKAKWKGKAPADIREPFIEGRQALGAFIEAEALEGRRYIWSETCGEVVALAISEEAVHGSPVGVVCYGPKELAILRGIEPDGLRQVHEAKKTFGGAVIAREESDSPLACRGVV